MPCICICGAPYAYNMGNFKTYYCTQMGVLDHMQGREIYANYHLKIPYHYIESLEHALEILENESNITMLLDELSSWIDCYDKPTEKNGGKQLKNLAKQTRKVKQKLFYTSQCWDDVPRSLRKLTHKVYITGKYHLIAGQAYECTDDDCRTDNYLGVFEAKIQDTNLIQKTPIKFFPQIPEIFNIYDTNEIILKNKKCEIPNKIRSAEELKELKIWV